MTAVEQLALALDRLLAEALERHLGRVEALLRRPAEPAEEKVGTRAPTTDLLTVAEAAAVARAQPGTIRSWISSGRLPASKPSRHWLVAREDLDRFLATPARPAAEENVERLADRVLARRGR